MRFPIPCLNTWNIKSQFSAAPLSLPLSFYTSRGDNGLCKLQSFSVPDHWEFHRGTAPHKGWPRCMLMALSSKTADTTTHNNVMCYPEDRWNEQKTIFLGIQKNKQQLILPHKLNMYLPSLPKPGKRRQAPNWLTTRHQFCIPAQKGLRHSGNVKHYGQSCYFPTLFSDVPHRPANMCKITFQKWSERKGARI